MHADSIKWNDTFMPLSAFVHDFHSVNIALKSYLKEANQLSCSSINILKVNFSFHRRMIFFSFRRKSNFSSLQIWYVHHEHFTVNLHPQFHHKTSFIALVHTDIEFRREFRPPLTLFWYINSEWNDVSLRLLEKMSNCLFKSQASDRTIYHCVDDILGFSLISTHVFFLSQFHSDLFLFVFRICILPSSWSTKSP